VELVAKRRVFSFGICSLWDYLIWWQCAASTTTSCNGVCVNLNTTAANYGSLGTAVYLIQIHWIVRDHRTDHLRSWTVQWNYRKPLRRFLYEYHIWPAKLRHMWKICEYSHLCML
jgi:hypothetical protein